MNESFYLVSLPSSQQKHHRATSHSWSMSYLYSALFHTWFPLPHMCTVPRYEGESGPKTLRCHNSAGVHFQSTSLRKKDTKTQKRDVRKYEKRLKSSTEHKEQSSMSWVVKDESKVDIFSCLFGFWDFIRGETLKQIWMQSETFQQTTQSEYFKTCAKEERHRGGIIWNQTKKLNF